MSRCTSQSIVFCRLAMSRCAGSETTMRPPTHLASDVFLRRLLMRTSISGTVFEGVAGCCVLRPKQLFRGVCRGGRRLGRGPGLSQVGEVKKRHGRIVPHTCVHIMNGPRIG